MSTVDSATTAIQSVSAARRPAIARATAGWIALAALNCLVLVPIIGKIWRQPHDFGLFWTAKEIYLHHSPDRMFDLSLQRSIEKQAYDIPDDKLAERFLPYNHLPYEVFLWLPLDQLTPSHAFWVWRLFNIALLVGTIWTMRDTMLGEQSIARLFLVALAFFPVPYCLLAGQDTFITLALVAASAWLLQRQREFLAGAALGAAIFKFQLILPIVGILFLLRHWRLVLGFISSSVVWLGISTAMVTPKGMMGLFNLWTVGEKGAISCINPRTMPNIRGAAIAILSMGPTAAFALTLLVSIALLILATYQLRKQPCAAEIFAVGLCFALLVGFHTNLYDLALLLFPTLWLLQKQTSGSSRVLKAIALLLLFVSPIYFVTLLDYRLPYLFVVPAILWLALEIDSTPKPQPLPSTTFGSLTTKPSQVS